MDKSTCSLVAFAFALAYPYTPALAAQLEPAEPVVPEGSIQELSKSIASTQAIVKEKIARRLDPEEDLAQQYSQLQQLCAGKFRELENDQRRYAMAEARTQVVGNLLALIGSVTVYAPGKTLLMGLGISSGSSGTVSSTVTQFFSSKSSESEQTLLQLRVKLNEVFDRYDLIDPESDKRGVRRAGILARGTSVCLKLAATSSNPPVPAPEPIPPASDGDAPGS